MKTWGKLFARALVLTAAIATGELPPPAARREPEATGTASERAPNGELRPTQDAAQAEKRPAVRVILPSPYSKPR